MKRETTLHYDLNISEYSDVFDIWKYYNDSSLSVILQELKDILQIPRLRTLFEELCLDHFKSFSGHYVCQSLKNSLCNSMNNDCTDSYEFYIEKNEELEPEVVPEPEMVPEPQVVPEPEAVPDVVPDVVPETTTTTAQSTTKIEAEEQQQEDYIFNDSTITLAELKSVFVNSFYLLFNSISSLLFLTFVVTYQYSSLIPFLTYYIEADENSQQILYSLVCCSCFFSCLVLDGLPKVLQTRV